MPSNLRQKAAAKFPRLRAVDEKGRFILGYARHLCRVRPGVDLTAPTYALASEVDKLRAELATLKGLSPGGSVAPSGPMPTVAKKPATKSTRAPRSAASGKRVVQGSMAGTAKFSAPATGLFAGREHVFGALSFKPVKGAAAKKLVHARILADHNT